MKLFSALLVLISFNIFAAEYNPNLVLCENPKINLIKMNEVLSSIKSNRALPFVYSKNSVQVFSENKVTEKVRELSIKIQNEIFGKEVLKIDFIPAGLSAYYTTENNTHKLKIGLGLVKHILENKKYQDGESLLAFILAHEISHLIQVISESPYELSVNGNVHYLMEDKNMVKKIVVEEVKRRGFDSNDRLINSVTYTNLYLYSHQEVDVYALLILKKLGMNLPRSKDFKLVLDVMEKLKSSEQNFEIKKISALEAKYNEDLMNCFIKTRLEYIDQFIIESKKI